MTAREVVERARDFLRGRKASYCRTFNLENRDNEAVLVDLAKFCRAHESTADSVRLDGRREVWLRIQQHLNLDSETLWKLYGGPPA